MTGILKRISDYERLAAELEESKKSLAEAGQKLNELRSELEKVKGQLDSAVEKAREERRRRAEEESRRGKAEKECGDKAKELEDLSKRIADLEARASRPELFAVLGKDGHEFRLGSPAKPLPLVALDTEPAMIVAGEPDLDVDSGGNLARCRRPQCACCTLGTHLSCTF